MRNAIERGDPRKAHAYGLVGWWNALRISEFNGSKPVTFADLSGNGLVATQSTDARRGTFSATGWNGTACVDYGSTAQIGYTTANVSLGTSTLIALVQGNANSGYVITHAADDNYVFGNAGASIRANRGGGASEKGVSATWVRDGVKKQVTRTFDGTNAGHLAHVNAVDQAATTVGGSADPGAGAISGPVGLGCTAALSTTLIGLFAEAMVFSGVLPDYMLRRLLARQRAIWPLG